MIFSRVKTRRGWRTGGGICATDPVTITFDDPDLAMGGAGVPLGFTSSRTAYPICVIADVDEPFDSGSYDVYGDDGNSATGGYPNAMDAVGGWYYAMLANGGEPFGELRLRRQNDVTPPSQGGVTVRVVYFDTGGS